MINRSSIALFAWGLFLAGASAFAQSLPPFGLATSETAQINLVNTAGPDTNGTAPSCTGTVTFYNYTGVPIGTSTNFTIGTAQIFSVKLPFSLVTASGSRAVIRAEIAGAIVTTSVLGSVSLPPCSLKFSLETYDSTTGVTHLFFSGQERH
jgi:hypothetical protein